MSRPRRPPMEEFLRQVASLLLAVGWTDDGRTQTETVRIPTTRSPVFGGAGGEIRTFGGRRRFKRGEERVTIGARSIAWFRVGDRGRFVEMIAVRKTVEAVEAPEFGPVFRPAKGE